MPLGFSMLSQHLRLFYQFDFLAPIKVHYCVYDSTIALEKQEHAGNLASRSQ